jgi:hypothetical protein
MRCVQIRIDRLILDSECGGSLRKDIAAEKLAAEIRRALPTACSSDALAATVERAVRVTFGRSPGS